MSFIDITIIILILYVSTKIYHILFDNHYEHLIMLSRDKLEYIPEKDPIRSYIFSATNPIVPYISPTNRTIDDEIPLNIYTVWHSKELPKMMKYHLDKAINDNPEFNFIIYSIDDCRNFIKENFNENVLNAFDKLIPVAYKIDLWRYCVLYKNGGTYLDIKFIPVNGFKFIDIIDKERFTLERDGTFWKDETFGICNAFIITKPENEILGDCIENIIDNVTNKYYGFNFLYPTGPGLLGQIYLEHKKKYDDIDIFFVGFPNNKYTIQYKNSVILESYPGYEEERTNGGNEPYSKLWKEMKIYS